MGKYGRVNPETVGQATGILDKRARDIFEGDILKIHHKTPLPVGPGRGEVRQKAERF